MSEQTTVDYGGQEGNFGKHPLSLDDQISPDELLLPGLSIAQDQQQPDPKPYQQRPLTEVPEDRYGESEVTIVPDPSQKPTLNVLELARECSYGLQIEASFDQLAFEDPAESDEEDKPYIGAPNKESTNEPSSSAAIPVRLCFRQFRAFRTVRNIKDLYQWKKPLGEG